MRHAPEATGSPSESDDPCFHLSHPWRFGGFSAIATYFVESASLDRIVRGFLEFYAAAPASGVAPDAESDMLLFQYGVYDWGAGEHFEFDLTRQFIVSAGEGDDAISQLRCTTMYEATAMFRAIRDSNIWCPSRDDLGTFREHILASRSYQVALSANRETSVGSKSRGHNDDGQLPARSCRIAARALTGEFGSTPPFTQKTTLVRDLDVSTSCTVGDSWVIGGGP